MVKCSNYQATWKYDCWQIKCESPTHPPTCWAKKWKRTFTPPPRETQTQAGEYEVVISAFPCHAWGRVGLGEAGGSNDWCITPEPLATDIIQGEERGEKINILFNLCSALHFITKRKYFLSKICLCPIKCCQSLLVSHLQPHKMKKTCSITMGVELIRGCLLNMKVCYKRQGSAP